MFIKATIICKRCTSCFSWCWHHPETFRKFWQTLTLTWDMTTLGLPGLNYLYFTVIHIHSPTIWWKYLTTANSTCICCVYSDLSFSHSIEFWILHYSLDRISLRSLLKTLLDSFVYKLSLFYLSYIQFSLSRSQSSGPHYPLPRTYRSLCRTTVVSPQRSVHHSATPASAPAHPPAPLSAPQTAQRGRLKTTASPVWSSFLYLHSVVSVEDMILRCGKISILEQHSYQTIRI